MRKNDDFFVSTVLVIFIAAVFILVIAAVNVIKSWKCSSQWEDSGYQVLYSFSGGCRLKMPDGKIVPAQTLRKVENE